MGTVNHGKHTQIEVLFTQSSFQLGSQQAAEAAHAASLEFAEFQHKQGSIASSNLKSHACNPRQRHGTLYP